MPFKFPSFEAMADGTYIVQHGERKYDEKIYLCGSSSKDAGNRITSILEDPDRMKYTVMIKELLKNIPLILK